jgi:hypothetical protein
MPLNEASRDLVVACDHKQVLDVTLKVKKGWKSVVEHIITKWSSIENISKRLQLYLFKEGEISTTTNYSDEYFFEENVEAVLMRDAGFRAFIINPLPKSPAESVPMVLFSYGITIPDSDAPKDGSILNESSLLPGYTVMDDSWMHAFSLIANPTANIAVTPSKIGQGSDSQLHKSSDLDSLLKRHDLSLPVFSASVMGRFASGASNILPSSHSLMGGVLQGTTAPGQPSSTAADIPLLAAKESRRIYENVEKAIMSSSPNTVKKGSTDSVTSQPSPNSSNLSVPSVGGEDGSNLSVNTLQVRYKKKRQSSEVKEDVDNLATITMETMKASQAPEPVTVISENALSVLQSVNSVVESTSSEIVETPRSPVATTVQNADGLSQVLSPTIAKTSMAYPMTPERNVLKNDASQHLSPCSERKHKRVRFEYDNVALHESPSMLSPIAKATARSVSKGQVYIDPAHKELIKSQFMHSLDRKGRSRPELRRIKPTFVRPLS